MLVSPHRGAPVAPFPSLIRAGLLALPLLLGCSLGGCYASHGRDAGQETPPPLDDAGADPADAGTPTIHPPPFCSTVRSPYRGSIDVRTDPPVLRFHADTPAVTGFDPVPAPFGFVASIDVNADDSGVVSTVLLALSRTGETLWRWNADEPLSLPVVADDGTVWLTLVLGSRVVGVRDGRVVVEQALEPPEGAGLTSWRAHGLLSTGELVVTRWSEGGGELLSLDPCGRTRWALPLAAPPTPPLLDDDSLYFVADQQLHHVRAGRVVWRQSVDGTHISGAPAVASTGEAVVASSLGSAIRITAVNAGGARTFDVPREWFPGRGPIGALLDPAIVVRGSRLLSAINLADGEVRWEVFAHPNIPLSMVGVPAGLLVRDYALRLRSEDTGEPLWTVEPPNERLAMRGLAIDGPLIVTSMHDGSWFGVGW